MLKKNFKVVSPKEQGLPEITDAQINKLFKLYTAMDSKYKLFKGSKRDYCTVLAGMVSNFVNSSNDSLIGSGKLDVLERNIRLLAAKPATTRTDYTLTRQQKLQNTLAKKKAIDDKLAEVNREYKRYEDLNRRLESTRISRLVLDTLKKVDKKAELSDQILSTVLKMSEVFDEITRKKIEKIMSLKSISNSGKIIRIEKIEGLPVGVISEIETFLEEAEESGNFNKYIKDQLSLNIKDLEKIEAQIPDTVPRVYTRDQVISEFPDIISEAVVHPDTTTEETTYATDKAKQEEKYLQLLAQAKKKANKTVAKHFPEKEAIFDPEKMTTLGLLPDSDINSKYFESNQFKGFPYKKYKETKDMTAADRRAYDSLSKEDKKKYRATRAQLALEKQEPVKDDYDTSKKYSKAHAVWYKKIKKLIQVENPFFTPEESRVPKYDTGTSAEKYETLVSEVLYYRDLIKAFRGSEDETSVKNFIIALPFTKLTEISPEGESQRRIFSAHLISKDRKTLVGMTKLGWGEVEEATFRSEFFVFWKYLQDSRLLTTKEKIIENYKLLGKIFSLSAANDRIDFDYSYGLSGVKYLGESKGKKTAGGMISEGTKEPQVNYDKILAAILRSSSKNNGKVSFSDPNILFTLYKSDMDLGMWNPASAKKVDQLLPFEIIINLNIGAVLDHPLNERLRDTKIIPYVEEFLKVDSRKYPKVAGDMAVNIPMFEVLSNMMENYFSKPNSGTSYKRETETNSEGKRIRLRDDKGYPLFTDYTTPPRGSFKRDSGEKTMISLDISDPMISSKLTTAVVSKYFLDPSGQCTPQQYSEYYTDPQKIRIRRRFIGSTYSDYIRPNGDFLNVVKQEKDSDEPDYDYYSSSGEEESDIEEPRSEDEPEKHNILPTTPVAADSGAVDTDDVDVDLEEAPTHVRREGTGKNKAYHKKVIKYY